VGSKAIARCRILMDIPISNIKVITFKNELMREVETPLFGEEKNILPY